ncbi:hypothetical protein [Immundisolibacter sp.]|uniref:hypothetical protein n=1 Tax=Immundisolibacter sp. TaxID=1934948 RepID=UPI002615BF8C|nr:hypothetical protein [Immundisolibacter sp.]MDD3649873.1 hypothetical protein [Immundisolibacter sp.]
MNDDIRMPEPDQDDIPTLTDIVVPGRPPAQPAPPASEPPPEFVFDIDFDHRQTAAPTPAVAPPAVDVSADDDLPLPWSDEGGPSAVVAQTADVAPAAGGSNAEALLAELLNDIGARLQRRIDAELELAGQRLRAALREELDRTLAELTRGTPPTA